MASPNPARRTESYQVRRAYFLVFVCSRDRPGASAVLMAEFFQHAEVLERGRIAGYRGTACDFL